LKLLAPTLLAKLDKNFKAPPAEATPADRESTPNISSTFRPALAGYGAQRFN
jgi:hypothetical protein